VNTSGIISNNNLKEDASMSAKFIITINRQYGSHGREIGRKLAEKLDVKYYDKELITLAAKESGYSRSLFENADEKPSNSLLYSLVMGSYAARGWFFQQDDVFSYDKLFSIQADVIRKVAAESCVIVGRCADFLLREEPGLITVFTHSPIEYRLKNARSDHPNISDKDLEALIRRADKSRANYYSYYTSRDWANLFNYNLAIDTSFTGIDGAVDLIINLKETRQKRGE
jgi:cytidylate kinase